MAEQWTVVRLKGGLGNQLFQFAFGLSSVHAHGGRLLLDTSWFRSQDLRHEELTTAFDAVPVADIAPRRVLRAVRVRMPDGGRWMRRRAEGSFRFAPQLREGRMASSYFDGYFQSWRYFEGVQKEIDTAFTLARPSEWLGQSIANLDPTSAIGLHVRLGDYRTDASASRVHGLLSPDYYTRGLAEARARTGLDRVIVFSDEPDLARTLITGLGDAHFVDAPPTSHPMESIALLAACGARVIANSSFSWWASYLADARPEATFAPWPWFRSGKHDAADLLPPAWVRVKADWTGS